MRRPFELEDTELIFDEDFNEVLTPELFEGLDVSAIYFQDIYNQPIPPNVIPGTVWGIEFGDSFNQPLVPGALPEGLETVTFGKNFNQPITGAIPDSMTVISFGDNFNQPLLPGDLNNVSTINFGRSFNQDIRGVFSEGVTEISFGDGFNQPLYPEYFPSTISLIGIGANPPKYILKFSNNIATAMNGATVPISSFWDIYNSNLIQEDDEDEDDDDEDIRYKLLTYEPDSMKDITEDAPEIPSEEWDQLKEFFEAEFGDRPMDPSEVMLFLDGMWGDTLRNPFFRPFWAEKIHDIFTRYTAPGRVAGEDINVRIPDLQIYKRLISLSPRYRRGDPASIEQIVDEYGMVQRWDHHMFEFVQYLLLESYNYPMDKSEKEVLRRLLIKFLERIKNPITSQVIYNGSETTMEITFDRFTLMNGSVKVFTREITETRVEGNTKYIVEAVGITHTLEFDSFDQRKMAIVPVESVRAGIILMKHPKLSLTLNIFRQLPRSVITSYIQGRFDSVYVKYAPETPHIIEADVQLPGAIRDILRPDETVLAGGNLMRMIIGGEFPPGTQSHELSDKLNSYVGLERRNTQTGVQDYDLYTTKSIEEISEYFLERGYENAFDEEYMAERWMSSYGGWLTRYYGPNDEQIDVIHVHHHITFDRPICARPQDFIAREFDIDITKAWYDGEKVSCMSQKIHQNILDRKMTLDFHPMMSINQYKTRTTMGRIFKYESRGFQFVIQDNEEVIERFTDRLAKISLLATRKGVEYSPEMLVNMIERLEPVIAPAKDKIMDYDRYYVKVRDEQVQLDLPVPNPPLVTRPEEHLFLSRVARRHADRLGVFDDFFKRVLGISVYEFTGGVYGMDLSRIRPSWRNHLHHINPAFVLKFRSRSDLRDVYRWAKPEFDIPRCTEVFTPRSAQPDDNFAAKLKEYIAKCNEMEEIQNCNNYIEEMRSYIIDFAGIERKGRRKTVEVSRGDELLSALRNIDLMHLEYRDIFVKYVGESGIDAGGPAKDFLTSVMRQLRALFGYVSEEVEDKRMFISSLPDQEIIDNLNSKLTTKSLTVDDLPALYKLAGVMCRSAIVNGFNTNIPMSRVLLYIMTSGDMGIDTDAVTSAFILEGKYNIDEYINLEKDVYEGFNEDSALDKYLISNEVKRSYIDMFANGFSNMSSVLKFFKVAGHELYMAICGNKITADTFETFFTNPSRVDFKSIRPEFTITIRDGKLTPMVDETTQATDVLMRGRKYTFIADRSMGLFMNLADSLVPEERTVNLQLGDSAEFIIPEDAPGKLYLMAAGQSSFIEYTVINNASTNLLRIKLINYLIGRTEEESFLKRFREVLTDKLGGEDQELAAMLRGMMEDLEVPPEPNLMTDEQVVVMYYQLVLKSITAYTVIGASTMISVQFNHGVVQLFPHSCFSTLEVSATWLANSSFEDWLDTGLPAFFELKYSAG